MAERSRRRRARHDIIMQILKTAKTGEKKYVLTEEVYIHRKNGIETSRPKLQRSKKLAEKDPYKLISTPGTAIEKVYADHSRQLKNMANQARLKSLDTQKAKYDRAAAKTYSAEVDSLNAKYKEAVRSRPVERKAQIMGNEIYRNLSKANPDLSYSDRRNAKARSLARARTRLDAKKPTIDITPREWTAIEMGAVSPTRLKGILRHADMDVVRQHATPRATRAQLSPAKATRAKALLKGGYTNKEVAQALGIPVSQVRDIER